MTSETVRPRSVSLLLALLSSVACASFVEVPVETPLSSKLDVGAFRRVLIAGFVTEPGEADVVLETFPVTTEDGFVILHA